MIVGIPILGIIDCCADCPKCHLATVFACRIAICRKPVRKIVEIINSVVFVNIGIRRIVQVNPYNFIASYRNV